jgi:hypothetical protein
MVLSSISVSWSLDNWSEFHIQTALKLLEFINAITFWRLSAFNDISLSTITNRLTFNDSF